MEHEDLLHSLLATSYVTARFPIVPPARRPWKSLNPYEEEDSDLFFGRASDLADLLSHILSFDVTVLYGASGVGKTSLLNAAVIPALRGMDMRVARFSVASDPVMALRAAVYRACPEVLPNGGASGQHGMVWSPLVEQASLKPGVRLRLRELLTTRLSPTDLQGLCANLQEQIPELNFHNFAGGLADKVLALSSFLDERQQWHLLVQELWTERSDLRLEIEETWQGNTHYRRTYPLLDTIELSSAKPAGVIIICDEFEKIFVDNVVPNVARKEFVAEVVGVISRDDLPIKWVFSLRKEALGDFFAYAEPQSKRLVANLYRLDPLNRDQATEAISLPAKRGELLIEPCLVGRLLDDLTTNDSIEPTQLQIVCNALFDRASAQRAKRLTLGDYISAGETRGILKNYLNRVIEQRFHQEDIPSVKDLLVQLAGAQETTVALSAQTLAERLDLPRPQVEGYLRNLMEACLIRPALVDGGVMYELTHAYLLKEISSWLGREALALKRLQELVAQSVKIWDLEVPLPLTQEALDLIFPHRLSLRLSRDERLLVWQSAVLYGTRLGEWCAICRTESEQLSIIDSELDLPQRHVLEALRWIGTLGAVQELLRICINDADQAIRSLAAEHLAELDASPARARLIEQARTLPRHQRLLYQQALAAYRDRERLTERLPIRLRLAITRELARRRLRRGIDRTIYLAIGAALGSLPLFSLLHTPIAQARFEPIAIALALAIGAGEALTVRHRKSAVLLGAIFGGLVGGMIAGIVGVYVAPNANLSELLTKLPGNEPLVVLAWGIMSALLALIPAFGMVVTTWSNTSWQRRTVGLVLGGLVVGGLTVLGLALSKDSGTAFQRPEVLYAACDMAFVGLGIGFADYFYEHSRNRST